MAVQINKLLSRSLLTSCWQRNVDVRWWHSGMNSSEFTSLLVKKNQPKCSTTLSFSKAAIIPLPGNVKDINAIETGRFSPQRTRDITGDVIVTTSVAEDSSKAESLSYHNPENDQQIDSYDCSGTVSLNSAMQTNVPQPFVTGGKAPVHLNMPGGEWGRSDKYIAEDMQKALFNNDQDTSAVDSCRNKGISTFNCVQDRKLYNRVHWWIDSQKRLMSSSSDSDNKHKIPDVGRTDKIPGVGDVKASSYDKLMLAVSQYGGTVVVFHTGISLLSLGACYLAVTSGVDLIWLTTYLPLEIPEEVGGFIIAYAIHKAMAPIRVSITLVCAPVIVKYLRKKGFLRQPSVYKYHQGPNK